MLLCTFELLPTLGQSIHPLQNFRIGSLVTVRRLNAKENVKNVKKEKELTVKASSR